MLAKGKAGVVPPNDKHGLSGLVIANTAQTSTIHKLRPPTFGTLTTVHGGEARRELFLVLQALHMPQKPDIVGLRGKWLLQRCDFDCFYDEAGIRFGDVQSGAVLDSMSNTDYILCLDWHEFGAFKNFEPSAKAFIQGQPSDDPDSFKLVAVVRNVAWGKTRQWKRVQNISQVLNKSDYSMRDLLTLLPADEQGWVKDMVTTPVISPPSGIVPSSPSFQAIEREVFYAGDTIYRVGASAGEPMHLAEYRDGSETRYGLLLGRPGSKEEPVSLREMFTPAQLLTPTGQLQARFAQPCPLPPQLSKLRAPMQLSGRRGSWSRTT